VNHSLFEALLDPTLPTPAGLRVWNGSDPAARFAIHRNHLRVSLTSALAQSYPVTRTLVGEPFFNAMAWQFIRQAPPRLPMLACHGAALPNFIDSFAPAATLPYLADVARLEWLRIEACHAADAVELPTASLTRQLQQPATLARLKITFQPSVRLLTSRHAVVSIWAAHQGRGDLRAVDPVLPESALILRPQLDVELIFVTGGVVSSLGKGIASASLGAILEARGLKVTMVKLDPYINVDPGTMSPFQHGEVFVTEDGAETDLDLGHYERFVRTTTGRNSNFTTGRIYETVIARSAAATTWAARCRSFRTSPTRSSAHRLGAGDSTSAWSKIGGTVGDIESLPFLEAIRQFGVELGAQHCVFMHLTLVPYIASAGGEIKTKPTQHSVKELRSIGIQPDVLHVPLRP
jgi:hypothetical protein